MSAYSAKWNDESAAYKRLQRVSVQMERTQGVLVLKKNFLILRSLLTPKRVHF
jgi:hypothetical protein